MLLRVISTGSGGNCYLLEDDTGVLVLDAGLPIRKIIPHIRDMRKVCGCVVTHEHNDHAKGAYDMAMRGVKVFCSTGTAQEIENGKGLRMMNAIQGLVPIQLGAFTIMGFQTQHDAAEPFGFLIRNTRTGETAVYATDTYYLRYTFPNVNYWIVECNYCDEILESEVDCGEISGGLRKRLKESHMSLKRLKDALKANDLSQTRKIVLIHLSDARSDEERMIREIEDETMIETVAALNGQTIELSKIPF